MTATGARCPHREGIDYRVVTTENGFTIRLDLEVLDALGELRATLAGRRTYTEHTGSGAVFHRGAFEIRTRPAGQTPRQDVHAEHPCNPHP